MQIRTKLAALLFATAVTVTGCADASTDITGPKLSPVGPAYDGIGWFGSGNRAGSDSTTTATNSSDGTAEGTTVTGAGTGWFGSGN